MLHHKPVLFPDDPAPQCDRPTPGKRRSQKRHPKPDDLQGSRKILYIEGGDLHLLAARHLYPSVDGPGDRHGMALLQLPDGRGILIDLVSPGIVAKQVADGADSYFSEGFLSLLTDSFDFPDS